MLQPWWPRWSVSFFLERPQNATALAAFFRPTLSILEHVSALALCSSAVPIQVQCICSVPPVYTYAELKVLVAGGHTELSYRDAGTQTPTLPHTAEWRSPRSSLSSITASWSVCVCPRRGLMRVRVCTTLYVWLLIIHALLTVPSLSVDMTVFN